MIAKPRLAWYVAAYLALMTAIALLTPWRHVDWYVAGKLSPPPPLASNIVFLGLTSPAAIAESELAAYRERLSSLLRLIASGQYGRPMVLLLDIRIRSSQAGLAQLTQAIQAVQGAGTKVYAAVDPFQPGTTEFNPDYMVLNEHAQSLYQDVLDGSGHTLMQWLWQTAKYDAYLDLGGGVSIPAVVIKIAEDFFQYPVVSSQRSIVIQVGPREDFLQQAYRFEAGTLSRLADTSGKPAKPDLNGKLLIVGNPQEKPPAEFPEELKRPGPELLAWALSARISRSTAELKVEPWLLVTYTLGLSGLACFLARFLYLRSPALRSRYPSLAPLAGGALALLGLVFVVWFLRSLNFIYPMVTLVAAGIVAASVMTALYLRRKLQWALFHAERIESTGDYDVFISYSRTEPEHIAWVAANVVEPLRTQARKPDGSPLKVFFDKESIRLGDDWPTRVAHDVNSSRVFVPIYSRDYFSKPVCKYEMEQALKMYVMLKNLIVPVMRSQEPVAIPNAYDGINYIDAIREPEFARRLVERVSQAIAEVQLRAVV